MAQPQSDSPAPGPTEAPTDHADVGYTHLTVSIISMGDTDALASCIGSLHAAAADVTLTCVVIDNSDRAAAVAATAAALGARVIRVTGKHGFGANHNLVLREVIQTGASRYILVLNDDVLLNERALAKLVAHMDTHPLVGALAPQLLYVDGSAAPTKMQFPSLGSEVARWIAQRQISDSKRAGWLVGACMMLRVSALAMVGVFDERFFLYYEDVDLCVRLSQAGLQCEVDTAASAVHIGHQSIGPATMRSLGSREYRRSRRRYFMKYGKPFTAALLTTAGWFAVPLRPLSSTAREERAAQHRIAEKPSR